MQEPTETQASELPADEPIGTPPAGGSWRWEGGQWVRNEPTPQQTDQE